MSGLSKLQREILKVALTVNAHTQGGVPRIKFGKALPGYTVPTVDYSGPKDIRPALLMWAVGGFAPSGEVSGFFLHTRQSRCIKASITRAVSRLNDRGLFVFAPLPRWQHDRPDNPDWGYVLTVDGFAAAGDERLEIPRLDEACELFGITHQSSTDHCRWDSGQRSRKAALIQILRNGCQGGAFANRVAEGQRLPASRPATPITVAEVA